MSHVEAGSNAGARENSPLSRLEEFVRRQNIQPRDFVAMGGVITAASHAFLTARGLGNQASLGDGVMIDCGEERLYGEIIHLDETQARIKPYDEAIIPPLKASAFATNALTIAPDISWRGRVVNARAIDIDGRGPLKQGEKAMAVEHGAPPALKRERLGRALKTGIKVIDIFTPLVFGQRMGIFAGSGVGKSTLLAMLTQADHFDTVVLGLTGERGREVRDMLDDTLRDKRDKVVSVVATGDESPMMRRLAPASATTIAEYFAALGHNVLLLIDSVTRYALAAREVAIAAGEPPVSRGFPPSVFSHLPRLLERAGPSLQGNGSITGIYAVLVDGDDHNDPVADAIRGTLDGHIVLDRAIAARGQFPAVDIPASISRLATSCWSEEQRRLVQGLKEMICRYEESRDLRSMGAYHPGSDVVLDQALKLVPPLYEAMQQHPDSPPCLDVYDHLAQIVKSALS